MKARDIDFFFGELDQKISFPVTVILIGGGAALLYGSTRATFDIDFEINIKKTKKSAEEWEVLKKSLAAVAEKTRITPQYGDNIDRWSMIPLPTKKSTLYKKIGKIEIRLLDPALWAVGKLARFLPSDLEDLIFVLKKSKTDPKKLAQLWGQALRISPPSPSQIQFRRQVESFFQHHTHSIWGTKVNSISLITRFHESAKISS